MIPAHTVARALVAALAVGPLLTAAAGPAGPAPELSIELPPSPAADLAERARKVEPAELAFTPWPGRLDAPGWDREGPWLTWARLVRAEAESTQPARRASLALAAAIQGRNADAWRHFVATAGDPAVAAAALPHLFPGVPVGFDPTALPDGVILNPILPPSDRELLRGELQPRTMRVDGVTVGAAICSIELELASDGVQIDVVHTGGAAATLGLRLPEPDDFFVRVEYFDWERLETTGEPHVIPLLPSENADEEAERLSSWGRFAPRNVRWPAAPPAGYADAIVERVRRGGLTVEAEPELLARARGFAAALHELFGFEVPVVEASEVAADSTERPLDPTRIHFDAESGVEELRALVSIVERVLLGR